MSLPHLKHHLTAQNAVNAILAGKALDGSELPIRIPFTADADARLAASVILAHVLEALADSLSINQLTAITAKLLSHLSRSGAQTAETIRRFRINALVDALRDAPDLIAANTGIAGILRDHERRSRQAAAHLRRRAAADVPDGIALWQNGRWRLEEATDPRHLQLDSQVLKHCVGTLYSRPALRDSGLHARDPEASHCLHYWINIRCGKTRILTLTENGVPHVTLEYDVLRQAIVQMQDAKRDATLSASARYFQPLCQALGAMREPLNLSSIEGLPTSGEDRILTTSGEFVVPSRDNIHTALVGTVDMAATTSVEEMLAVCAIPLLRVDLRKVDTAHYRHLPVSPRARIGLQDEHALDLSHLLAGSLAISAPSISLENLRHGDVTVFHTAELDLSEHQYGNINGMDCASVWFPRHHTGSLLFTNLRSLYVPEHCVGGIGLGLAETLVAPNHTSGEIFAMRLRQVHLPNLRAGTLSIASAKHLFAPNLLEGHVTATSLSHLELPAHEVGDIDCSAATISLPNHRRGKLKLPNAKLIHAPHHSDNAVRALNAERASSPVPYPDGDLSNAADWSNYPNAIPADCLRYLGGLFERDEDEDEFED